MKWTDRERRFLNEMGIALPMVPEATAARVASDLAAAPTPADAPTLAAAQAPVTAPAPTAARALAAAPAPSTSPAVSAVPIGGPLPMDRHALAAAVAGCERCGLCRTRRQTVFGVGASPADWMVVGEAPGEQEDRQGEPFVGPAGQLLDRMLAAIGLDRAAPGAAGRAPVFITNTIKCRPPQNRNPAPEELAACAPYLGQQLLLVQPKVILAMGRFAAQQLLQTDEPIGRLRGRVHAVPAGEGGRPIPVVVTYHPAYLLRNPIDKRKAWDDLALAMTVGVGAGARTAGSGTTPAA